LVASLKKNELKICEKYQFYGVLNNIKKLISLIKV